MPRQLSPGLFYAVFPRFRVASGGHLRRFPASFLHLRHIYHYRKRTARRPPGGQERRAILIIIRVLLYLGKASTRLCVKPVWTLRKNRIKNYSIFRLFYGVRFGARRAPEGCESRKSCESLKVAKVVELKVVNYLFK